jgi:capsular polysaccharide biosynthesis protein
MSEKDLERMDGIDINIKDLLMSICLQWRKSLVWMLAGGIILGSVGAWKAYSENQIAQEALEMSKEEPRQSQTEILEELKNGLTDVEVAEVERVFGVYESTNRNCNNIAKYNAESVRMQLNPYAVPTLNLNYYIDNHYQAVYPVIEGKDNIDAIVASLIDIVSNNETCEKIVQELGWEKDLIYIRELITTKNTGNILYIVVNAPTQEECEIMRDAIMETVDIETAKLQAQFGRFDITVIENKYKLSVNTNLFWEQTALADNLYNLKNRYSVLESGLSEQQRGYLKGLKNMRSEVDEIDDTLEKEEISAPSLIQKKYVLLGVGIGVFLFCLWYFVKYMLSEKIHIAEDMEWRYQVRVLAKIGKIGEETKHRKLLLDKIIYAVFMHGTVRINTDEAIRVVQSEIRIAMRNIGMKKVYVASTCGTENCMEIRKQICANNEDEAYIVCGGNDINYNSEELEMMGKCDGIVFVEQINISKYEHIKRMVCFCKQNNLPIIGSVVIG